MLVAEPLRLLERRRNLVTLDQAVDLLEVTDQLGTAKLDLLVEAAGAGGIGVN
jgi:hypothetical protein